MLSHLRRCTQTTSPSSDITKRIEEWIDEIGPLATTAMSIHPTRSFAFYLDLGNACASIGFLMERNRLERLEDLLIRCRTHFLLLNNQVRLLFNTPSQLFLNFDKKFLIG